MTNLSVTSMNLKS